MIIKIIAELMTENKAHGYNIVYEYLTLMTSGNRKLFLSLQKAFLLYIIQYE
jgi:hypothetical protein